MNSYDLSRNFFNWTFENPEKINPNHIALYFFCIEHCNRLGWKRKFGLPSSMAKEAIGLKSYNTYIKTLNDLVEYGFIEMIEKSKNQYSSNIIALSNFNKARDKALDKATIKHVTKQSESTEQSIYTIDKPTNQQTNKPINSEEESIAELKSSEMWIESTCRALKLKPEESTKVLELLDLFYQYRKATLKPYTNHMDYVNHFVNWAKTGIEKKKSEEDKNKVIPKSKKALN